MLAGILQSSTSELGRRLSDSYRRLQETALEEWVPALPPHDDSHAGYPHTRNVQREMDKILAPVLLRRDQAYGLSETEAYILLASIQLHDIGRLREPKGQHGGASADIVRRHGVELGLVPDEHLIDCVAKVCECHDLRVPPSGGSSVLLPDTLPRYLEGLRRRQVRIEGHGLVRLSAIAAAVALADEMDESYLRAVPRYIRDEDSPGSEAEQPLHRICRGGLRRLVSSVEADHVGRCVVSVVDVSRCSNRFDDRAFRDAVRQLRNDAERTAWDRWVQGLRDHARICGVFKSLEECVEKPPQAACDFPRFRTFLEEGWPRPPSPGDTRVGGGEEVFAIASRLLSDLRDKSHKLKSLGEHLRPLGVDFRDWFLDVDGVLINREAEERYEPGLDSTRVQSVCQAIEALSKGIFGRTEFSYAELAAEARLDDLETVRAIVRRIAMWSTEMGEPTGQEKRQSQEPLSLVLGPDSWSLRGGSLETVQEQMSQAAGGTHAN